MNFLPLILTAVVLVALDSVYLSVNRTFMETQIQSVQKSPIQLNPVSLILCYLLLVLGLYYFVIRSKRGILEAFLLGIFVYGVYELTNFSTFKSWKLQMVFLDTLWGGILFGTTYFLVDTLTKYLR